MYVKLAERCKLIFLDGIHMVGCPISHVVFGLTKEGFEFVKELQEGINVDIDLLSESNRELFKAMDEKGFFQTNISCIERGSAYLHVTSRCNMNCVGCYSNSGCNQETVHEMSVDQIYHVIDNLVTANFNSIIVSGGEPFLHSGIKEILSYMKSRKCEVSCITNGTVSETVYASLLKYMNSLSFSMDGLDEETSILRRSTVKRIERLIKVLNRQETKIGIIFTLHKKNYHLYKEMKDYAKSLGILYNFSLFTAENNEKNSEFLLDNEDLIKLSEQFDYETSIMDSSLNRILNCHTCCGAGRSMISISSTGNIYPCHMMHQQEFLMGNALKDEISCIKDKVSPYGYFPVYKKIECKKCEYAYLCGGGCLYRAYALGGSLEAKEQLCNLYKRQIDQALAPFVN